MIFKLRYRSLSNSSMITQSLTITQHWIRHRELSNAVYYRWQRSTFHRSGLILEQQCSNLRQNTIKCTRDQKPTRRMHLFGATASICARAVEINTMRTHVRPRRRLNGTQLLPHNEVSAVLPCIQTPQSRSTLLQCDGVFSNVVPNVT
jgi:hypothetical protein